MVRPRLCRRILAEPDVTYFKPRGIPLRELEEVILLVDEFEAIRLKDLEGLEQEECAKKMNISQSTLSRLLKEGRKKLADAIISGQSIKIQGGNFKMAMPRGIGAGFGGGRGFGSGRGFGAGRMQGNMAGAGPGGICKCPKCSYEEPKIRGQPCMNKKCPKCGSRMIRE